MGKSCRMEEGTGIFKMLTCKPAGNRSLGRLRRGWEKNIRMDLKKRCQYEELG